MLCLYGENASLRAQNCHGAFTKFQRWGRGFACRLWKGSNCRWSFVTDQCKSSKPIHFLTLSTFFRPSKTSKSAPSFYQNKLSTSPARLLSDIAMRGRDTMLSSPASLQCDNDESTIKSKEPMDDSGSSCQDELNIPDAVHADFSKHGLAVNREGQVYWQEGETHHPRNWQISRKFYDSFLVILFEFVAWANVQFQTFHLKPYWLSTRTVFSNTGVSYEASITWAKVWLLCIIDCLSKLCCRRTRDIRYSSNTLLYNLVGVRVILRESYSSQSPQVSARSGSR